MALPDADKPRETGKQRAIRIPLDYFKQADSVTRWKLRLTALALVLALGWWASGFVTSDGGRLRYSRGPVAAVHATWEANCEACHAPFSPINGSNWSTPLVGNAHESDARCESCHAGPIHHASQTSTDTPGCAGCHRDHRGRAASLVRLPDSDCTNCHRNLAAHTNGTPLYENAITRFDRDHPEFHLGDPEKKTRLPLDRMKEKDPGKLKFNHKVHMVPGMDGVRWKLSDIRDKTERDRYREQQPAGQKDDAALIQLDCSSCHVLERADLSTKNQRLTGLPPRAAGNYMLPITYEIQCRACHPLTFDPTSPELTIPHRLQPEEVHAFLWGAYADKEFEKKGHDLLKQIRRHMPGTNVTEEEKKVRKDIDAKLAANMEKFLYRDKLTEADKIVFLGKQTCGECHAYEGNGNKIVPDRIVPTQVPEVWFKHAVFNHAAHRALDCLACHKDATMSVASNDVLLPGIDTCIECHSPQRGSSDLIRGGARFDCTECHRYHHGDSPLQGIGVAKRGVKTKRDIQRFLTGSGVNP